MDKKRRVVVTGMGVVSSIGIGLDTFWRNLLAGRSGISRVASFDTKDFRTHMAGEVKNFRPGSLVKTPEKKGRSTQFLLVAMKEAIRDAKLKLGLFDPSDISAIIGTTSLEPIVLEEINETCVKKSIENVSALQVEKVSINLLSIVVGREFGLKGFNFLIPTACSAGNYAIGYGFDLIKEHKAEVVFCCGVDVFFKSIHAGFNRLLIISPDRCRPFDRNRKGTILGEASAVLVLEELESARKRGATIYAEVLGYGLSCDAYNLTIPAREGIRKVMKKAIENSQVKKKDIDYINAHGTGTLNNDREEAVAIREVFGRQAKNIPVSSIKSMLGHTIGAASAIEALSCCLSIRDNIIPPTINLDTPDPECGLDIVANRPRRKRMRIVMNNSFAFGGNNACVIFGKVKGGKGGN